MTTRPRRLLRRGAMVLLALCVLLPPRRAVAHELEEASIALTIRADGLMELRLLVPWATVLHARLAPAMDPVAFLTPLVNKPPAEFARLLAPIQAQLMREIRLLDVGTGRRFEKWQWPPAAEVQRTLREELMSRIADGAAFHHGERLAATASLHPSSPATQARLATSAMLGPVLLTVTHPKEELIGRGGTSKSFPLR